MEIKPKNPELYAYRAFAYCEAGKKTLATADEVKAIALGGKLIEPCK